MVTARGSSASGSRQDEGIRPAWWLGLTGLALVILAAHGSSLRNGFTYDDFPYLVNNPAVTHPVVLDRYFLDAGTHSSGETIRTYRPLRTIFFALEHSLFGDDPLPYHCTNLLLHFGVVVLAWTLARRFLSSRRAWVVALLLACHPLASEVVLSIKSQDDLLATLTILTAMVLLTGSRAGRRASLSAGGMISVALLYGVALLCKESAASLPLLAACTGSLGVPPASGSSPPVRCPPWRSRAVLLALLLAVLAGYWMARAHAMRAVAAGSGPRTPPPLLVSSLICIPLYWGLFLWPLRLTIDYSYLPVMKLISLPAVGSVLLQGALACILFRTRRPACRVGLLWFYASLLPSLNLIPGVVMFAERFAYLPAWGLALIVVDLGATGLARIASPAGTRRLWVSGIMAGVIVLLTARSFLRAQDWRDNETLFRAALRHNPSSEIIRPFLATELLRQGRDAEAAAFMSDRESDIRSVPDSHQARSQLSLHGLAALKSGDYTKAAGIFEAITSTQFATTADWINLGTALTNLKIYERARAALEEAVRRDPASAPAHRMLGRIALESGNAREARRQFDRSCELDPDNALGWYYSVVARFEDAGKDGGEEAARERLIEARRRGVAVNDLFLQDSVRWRGAGGELKRLLESGRAEEGEVR